jgi:NAD(P)-dependent dehydrogenase (short-subunit alcohol dehydrogenase family)
VALVTGGGRGIGRAVALELARRGAAVAVLARSATEVAAVAAEIEAAGGRAVALSVDIADHATLERALAEAAALGPIDRLVSNAAVVGPLGPLAESDPAAWAANLQINLVGAYHCLRAVLPGMVARGWGRVIHVSSGAALGSGIRNGSAYSVSKAGLDMLTRAAAAEVAGSGVTVNGVYPGVVDTRMQTDIRATPADQLGAETATYFAGLHERGELRDPAEPAALIVALAASALNGEIVRIGSDQAAALLGSTT